MESPSLLRTTVRFILGWLAFGLMCWFAVEQIAPRDIPAECVGKAFCVWSIR